MGLEGGDLFIYPSNILLNYVCQFLSSQSLLDKFPVKEPSAYANFHRAIVEQGLPFGNLKPFVSQGEKGMNDVRSR